MPIHFQFRLLAVVVLVCSLLAIGPITGCKTESKPEKGPVEAVVDVPDPLTVLVIGDPGLGQRIARQWSARRDGDLTIVDQEESQFVMSGFQVDSKVDILIYPPAMIGELVSLERLQEVRKEVLNSDEFNKVELLKHFRTSVVRHANETWAVPLGGPNFALLCNRPLFDQINMGPPTTWEQLDRILVKISAMQSDRAGYKSAVLAAKVDMPLTEGWAVQSFLARVAPAICQRGKISTVLDRRTMSPLIASEPFIESLKHLKTIATQRSLKLSPDGVFELARSGQSTIAVAWPARGFATDPESPESNSNEDADEGNNEDVLIIGSLPGMENWYDQQSAKWNLRSDEDESQIDLIGFSGLVASVSSNSPNDRTAWEFLEWLPSKSISLLTMVESPSVGPFRASHLGDVSRWTGDSISLDAADEFADVVAANHQRSLTLMFPRIPGSRKYLDSLDKAVRQAVAGDQTAEDALKTAAQEWDEITDSLGRKAQISALRKETGL